MTKEELHLIRDVIDWAISHSSMRAHSMYDKAQEAMKIIVRELKDAESKV